jgi:hypothetical protein
MHCLRADWREIADPRGLGGRRVPAELDVSLRVALISEADRDRRPNLAHRAVPSEDREPLQNLLSFAARKSATPKLRDEGIHRKSVECIDHPPRMNTCLSGGAPLSDPYDEELPLNPANLETRIAFPCASP